MLIPLLAHRLARPRILAIAFGVVLGSSFSIGAPVRIWLSSHRDKLYYEQMAARYVSEVDATFAIEAQAFGHREMPDKLAIALRTGIQPPDIVQLDEVFFGAYLQKEVPFLDLTERIQRAGLEQLIVPQRLDLFAYKDRRYAVPQSLSAVVLYYRRDLFQAHGIDPAELDTWENFIRVGRRLAENGQGFLALDPSYFEILLRQRGGHLFDAAGRLLPDFALAVDTLQWLTELARSGVAVLPDRSTIFDPMFFSSDIANGEVMTVLGGDWYGLDMIQQFAPELAGQWGILPLPVWSDAAKPIRTSSFAGEGLLIYRGSEQIEASWRFIEWVMKDPQANAARFLQGNSFPAYKPSFRDPRLLQPKPFFGGDRLGLILVGLAPDVPRVVMNPRRTQAVFWIRETLLNQALYGEAGPEVVLAEFVRQLDREPTHRVAP